VQDFVEVQKLNGSAKSVADGPAEQASPEEGAYARIGWNPGKGHFSVEPWERLSLRTEYSDSAEVS